MDSVEKSLQRLEAELRRVSGSPGIAGGAPMSAEFLLSRIVDVVAGWSPAAGGVTEHGDLDGLADDDHPIYLKEKASGGAASEVPEHNHTEAAQGGALADESVLSRYLAPTVLEAHCTSGTLINSGTDTDITGATLTFTPAIASYALVWVVADFSNPTVAGDIFVVQLDVDGVDEVGDIVFKAVSTSDRNTVAGFWIVDLTAASHTLKLQGSRAVGTGAVTVVAGSNTKMLVVLIGDANVVAA